MNIKSWKGQTRVPSSVTRLGYFWKILAANFMDYFEKWHFLVKIAVATFGQTLGQTRATFNLTSCHTAAYLVLSGTNHRQLVVSIPRLSVPFCHLGTGQNKCYWNTLFYVTSVFTIKMSHNFGDDHIVLILPGRCQNGAAESIEIEITSYLCTKFHAFRNVYKTSVSVHVWLYSLVFGILVGTVTSFGR